MTEQPSSDTAGGDVRERVLRAAAALLARGGAAALTTRAVAAAAQVQAPTLYRLFGEKRGLLHAVAEHRLAAFVADKDAAGVHPDPVEDLRESWDAYVAFNMANGAVFAIMHEAGAPASDSPAARAGLAVLSRRVERVAHAGRLRVPVARAVALIHSAGVGVVTTLLATPEAQRDPQLSGLARDAALAAVLSEAPSMGGDPSIASLAVALASRVDDLQGLTPGERLLLGELMHRLSQG